LIKTYLKGKLIVAPIQSNPQLIVDLGTGIGLWAIEMGEGNIPYYFSKFICSSTLKCCAIQPGLSLLQDIPVIANFMSLLCIGSVCADNLKIYIEEC
jgi:hypothetical protein